MHLGRGGGVKIDDTKQSATVKIKEQNDVDIKHVAQLKTFKTRKAFIFRLVFPSTRYISLEMQHIID